MRISDWSSDVCSSDLHCGHTVYLCRQLCRANGQHGAFRALPAAAAGIAQCRHPPGCFRKFGQGTIVIILAIGLFVVLILLGMDIGFSMIIAAIVGVDWKGVV